MTEIRLPWPPTELSPNSRLHWSQLARAKKIYREACWAATMAAKTKLGEAGYLRVELTFYRPNRRAYDHDNLLARMKSGLMAWSTRCGSTIEDSTRCRSASPTTLVGL